MSTTLIKHHTKDPDFALFKTDEHYWIGEYFPRATHQNGEPPCVIVSEYFYTEQDALEALEEFR